MSNLDKITKNLKRKGGFQSVNIPASEPRKGRGKPKDKRCPECNTESVVDGFCVICGYEAK